MRPASDNGTAVNAHSNGWKYHMKFNKLSLALLSVFGLLMNSAFAAPAPETEEKEPTDLFTVNEVIDSLSKGGKAFFSNTKSLAMVRLGPAPFEQYRQAAILMSDWDKDMLPKNMPENADKVHALNAQEKEELKVILTLASEIRVLRSEASRIAVSVQSSKLPDYGRIMGFTYEFLNGSYGDDFIQAIQGADEAVDKCLGYVSSARSSPKKASWQKLLQYSGIQQYAFGSNGKAYNTISAGNAMMRYYRQVDKSFMESFLPNLITRAETLKNKLKTERPRIMSVKDVRGVSTELIVYIDALDVFAAKVEEHAKYSLATLKDIYDNSKNSGRIINGKLNLKRLNVSGVPATYVAPFSQGMIQCKDAWNALVDEGLVPLTEKQGNVKL